MADCPTGKVAYGTKEEALRAKTKIRKRVRSSRKTKRKSFETYPYRCRECGEWHFTSLAA